MKCMYMQVIMVVNREIFESYYLIMYKSYNAILQFRSTQHTNFVVVENDFFSI